jgi:hypothetical protein
VSRGSPSATIGSENRAVTHLTWFPVPRGEKRTTDGDSALTADGTLKTPTAAMIDNAAAAKRAMKSVD